MKKIFTCLIILLFSFQLFSQVPKTMSFQGVLMEIANGQPVTDGTDYSFDFAIYDVLNGGAPLWTESQSAVTIDDGVYSVILGSQGSPLTINFDIPYFLEITVSGGPGSIAPETLTPRAELTSSGYELNAAIQDLADGTLSNDKFSAYSDLEDEGYLDANSGSDLLTRTLADDRYLNIGESEIKAYDSYNEFSYLKEASAFLKLETFYWDMITSSTNTWTFRLQKGGSFPNFYSPNLYLDYNGVEAGYYDYTTGAYTTSSDRRLKKDIQPLGNCLWIVENLSPVTYRFKRNSDSEKRSIGFIAQDVLPFFPEAVGEPSGEEGYYGINYDAFGVLAIKAIQEQQELIDSLLTRIKILEKTNGNLVETQIVFEKRLAELESLFQAKSLTEK